MGFTHNFVPISVQREPRAVSLHVPLAIKEAKCPNAVTLTDNSLSPPTAALCCSLLCWLRSDMTGMWHVGHANKLALVHVARVGQSEPG